MDFAGQNTLPCFRERMITRFFILKQEDKTLAETEKRKKSAVKEDKSANPEKKKINWHETVSIMTRFYKYTAEYFWQWGVWRFIGGFFSASVGLLFNYRLGKVVDVIIDNDWQVAIKSIIVLASLAVFRMIIGYTNSLSAYRYDILSGRKLRKTAMERIHSLPIGYFESKHTGEVISRVVNDIDRLQNYYSDSIAGMWSYLPMNTVMGLWMLFAINWKLSLICVISIPLLAFVIGKISMPIAEAGKKIQECIATCNAYLRDFIEGIEIYKIFTMEKRHGKNFEMAVDEGVLHAKKKSARQRVTWAIGSFNYVLPTVLSYVVGGIFVSRGEMSIGDLVAFSTVLPLVANITHQFATSYTTLIEHTGIAKHFFELLDEKRERTDGGDYSKSGSGVELEFRNVSYSYPNGLVVLKDCSFKVPGGRTVAMVGASGGGKSTLFKLLCGYYTSYTGEIRINGAELSEWNLDRLRQNIAYVSQESYLFDNTILENIRFGKLDSTDEEVIEAAHKAYAHDFITELENGYNTKLGERGVRLSGGQAQRIAIARAILKNAPLILLDEPTAALDTKAEFYVQKALENLSNQKTVFVIAHRISTIEKSDNILVLENGHVIEQGNHGELVSRGGRYIELYSSQIAIDAEEAIVNA